MKLSSGQREREVGEARKWIWELGMESLFGGHFGRQQLSLRFIRCQFIHAFDVCRRFLK